MFVNNASVVFCSMFGMDDGQETGGNWGHTADRGRRRGTARVGGSRRAALAMPAPLALSVAVVAAASAAGPRGPCDILDAAGNPCVAAHSTTRALYNKYDGPLYNMTRSDGTSRSIGVLTAGGFANKKAHDTFCVKLDCVISNVFDQSPQKNHLGQRHKLVNASRHSVTIGTGKTPVYGMWFDPGFGYHVDNTTGVATGNDPESIYAVMSGKNFNGGCCFVSVAAPALALSNSAG